MYKFLSIIAFVLGAAPITEVLAKSPEFGEPVGQTMPLGNRTGSPIFNLPPNEKLISAFGERPVFSPDGTRIAFIGRSYGDAFEYDLRTGAIRNLTAHAPHNGFLRVHYLPDGSFLLLGPRVPTENREETRNSTIELFWMDAQAKGPPVALQKTVFEGVAVAHKGNVIAWSEITPRAPTHLQIKTTQVMTGRIVTGGTGGPRLEDVKPVLTMDAATQCLVEPQDFRPDDGGLSMPCYYYVNKRSDGRLTDVVLLDFKTGKLTTIPTPSQFYGEVEGMFPDGKHTLVECSGDRSSGMDICVLELKERNPTYTRLTHAMDFGRWKYGNPTVSPDGRKIAVQIGSTDVIDHGVGQGIVIIDLAGAR